MADPAGYRLSPTLVVVLCVSCFLAGRFTQQSANLPDLRNTVQLPTNNEETEGAARKLISGGAVVEHVQSESFATVKHVANRWVNASDPTKPGPLEFEQLLEESGLLQVKPPVPAGLSGNNFYTIIPFQIISWYPRAVVFPNFVDKARCESIIKLAKAHMAPSQVAYRPGEGGNPEQDQRTSSGTFLTSSMDSEGVLGWVEERIAQVTHLPAENGEAFNVLRYQNNQYYESHMDTFDPKDYGVQYSQRIATVLLYLSPVEEGGETIFKKEGKDGVTKPIYNFRNCDGEGLKYKPRQGDALLFFTVTPDLKINPLALHGGCPVTKGEKWVATKWIRDKA